MESKLSQPNDEALLEIQTIKFENVKVEDAYPEQNDLVYLFKELEELKAQIYIDKETGAITLAGQKKIISRLISYLKNIRIENPNIRWKWCNYLTSYASSLNKFYKEPNVNSKLYIALKELTKYEVSEALKLGANPNARNNEDPILIEAAQFCSCQKIKRLLKAGANPNAKNRYGETAINISSCYHYGERITKLLVKAGADINNQDRYTWHAINWVLGRLPGNEKNELENLVKRILKSGIDVNCTKSNGRTILDDLLSFACNKQDPEKILWLILILKHVDINELNSFFKKNEQSWIAKYFSLMQDIKSKVDVENKRKCEIYDCCSICLNYCIKPFKTICGHAFHQRCLSKWLKIKQECPTCRNLLVENDKEKN